MLSKPHETALPTTRWKLPPIPPVLQDNFTEELGIHPVLSRILIGRSIETVEQARRFISPSLGELHNPFLLKDIRKAAERLVRAVRNKEKIVIYGDYDVDGITSVAVLFHFLTGFYDQVDYYIPNRIDEGYSLNCPAIERIAGDGAGLIITVDCGTSDRDEISFARELGIDTIVLDHHELTGPLPSAVAVVNPNREDCRFPFKQLAGVGVVFNFVIALRGLLREQGFWAGKKYPNLKEYLDLVALGTIGDIAPLLDENRIFAKIGLDLINKGKRTGVQALREVSGLSSAPLDSLSASFFIIPRINAAGRMSRAGEAVELLLTEDAQAAASLARKMDEYNRRRQALEKNILEEIRLRLENSLSLDRTHAIVFASPEWHPGIIGIVASKLVDQYYRPTVLISLKDGIGKGSCRSIAEFDLHQALNRCHSLLLAHGGHRYAAGISIREEQVDEFRRQLEAIVRADLSLAEMIRQTTIDARCNLSEINTDLISQFELLAPFGSMNQEPVLYAQGVRVSSFSIVGRNHLKMRIHGDGVFRESIWFSMGHFREAIRGLDVDVVFTPRMNNWAGTNGIQLKMRDMALPPSP